VDALGWAQFVDALILQGLDRPPRLQQALLPRLDAQLQPQPVVQKLLHPCPRGPQPKPQPQDQAQ
jgi:hypothetical protein